MAGKRNREKAYLAFIILFLLPEVLRASELSDFLWRSVNFIVLAGILFYYLAKPFREAILNYASSQKKKVENSDREAKEAEEKWKETEKRWKELDTEVSRIKAEAMESATRERERIIKEAELEAEKIKKAAEMEIEAIYERGTREIRRFAAELAISEAEERIKKRMTSDIHKELINRYIRELEN